MRSAAALGFLLSLVVAGEARAAVLPAADTVVLLTSLDIASSVPPIWRWRYRDYNQKLEKEFRKHFAGKAFRLTVKHDADQHDLWRELRTPSNIAVFWVSHAAFAEGGAGAGGAAAIVDRDGFDVAPVLQDGHPGLKFLAIVGCSSTQVLEKIPGFTEWTSRAGTHVASSDSKIDAKKGLKNALKESTQALSVAPSPLPCPERAGIPVLAYRRPVATADGLPAKLRAARVLLKGILLGMLPPSSNEAPQLTRLHLPEGARIERAADLKLLLSTGDSYGGHPEPSDLGRLELSAEWPEARWNVFADAAGTPIGVTQHVYRYEGDLPPAPASEIYRPFHCVDAYSAKPTGR
ncbi:MAG TPA: hypothetical protein VM598_05310 [Bdellovibrionota bacterium]|nr:hypothetical protein [Bdellovibrionota bacterium]